MAALRLLLLSAAATAAWFAPSLRCLSLRWSRRRLSSPLSSSAALALPYAPPPWLPPELKPPTSKLQLAHLPTPVQRWAMPRVGQVCSLFLKRDDCTGCELSGNKVRKLEFLLADALALGCDSVITVGGIQSNHCRATAAAARQVGLEPHLILRGEKRDPGLAGNLLIDRMVGARIHIVEEEEFASKGGATLVREMEARLKQAGFRPYGFPSGGSNELGTWGYIQAIREIEQQCAATGLSFDRIYFACGSGGTGAGLALGVHYSSLPCELVGLTVDDSPDFFFDKIDGIYRELGLGPEVVSSSRQLLRLEDCVGLGYAQSTDAELEFLVEVAQATGICLDPVYSGKAALGMVADLAARPVKRALFIHTGGMLGLFAKEAQLSSILEGGWD